MCLKQFCTGENFPSRMVKSFEQVLRLKRTSTVVVEKTIYTGPASCMPKAEQQSTSLYNSNCVRNTQFTSTTNGQEIMGGGGATWGLNLITKNT